MANTKISAFTVGTPAATDRLVTAISPFGSGDNRYITPALLGSFYAVNTLAGGTITTSQPMTLTQTWNAGGVTFTGLLANITDTASAAASLLMDLQVGGNTKFKVDKTGIATLGLAGTSTGVLTLANATSGAAILTADAANTLAQRNGTSAQTWRLYNTFTDASNGEWLEFGFSSNVPYIRSTKNGTGTQRALNLGASGADNWQITTSGHLLALTDNTYDIGASGATRPRTGYFGTSVLIGNTNVISITTGAGPVAIFNSAMQFHSGVVSIAAGTASTAGLRFNGEGYHQSNGDGIQLITNFARSGFDRLQFGGTTSSFPALKRSTTTLQVKLADDSAFTLLESLSLKTQNPSGGTSGTWKLGVAASVTPTLPNRTIEVDIGGTIYYIHAKTTND